MAVSTQCHYAILQGLLYVVGVTGSRFVANTAPQHLDPADVFSLFCCELVVHCIALISALWVYWVAFQVSIRAWAAISIQR